MPRYLTTLVLLGLLALAARARQNPEPKSPPADEKGTYLGVLIGPVPDVLYDQVPALPRGQGVVVTHVLPDSPAAQARVYRHDILLQYDTEKVRDCEHFARLVRADKPERKVKLLLLRAGQEKTCEATLALGPVLRIAQAGKAADGPEATRGKAKDAGPPAVSVAATPLGGGQMKVTIEYYQEGTGRLRAVTCTGDAAEIDQEVQRLPSRVRVPTRVALERLRRLEFQQKER